MFVPSLAFNQVTGVNVHVTTWFVVLICVFYTSVGGLKAVVWTDVVQTFSMFGALILVAVKGTMDLKEGGIDAVFKNAYETNRIELPMYNLSFHANIFIFCSYFQNPQTRHQPTSASHALDAASRRAFLLGSSNCCCLLPI